MRSPKFNVLPNIADEFPLDISLTIFEKICLVRYFELGVIKAIKEKEIVYPVYLSSGQEVVASVLSMEVRDYMIFAQHRAHDIYLTFGGSPEKLRDELLGLSTGTSQGKAGSNCLQYHEHGISMFGHHGLIGENVPLGVGAALGSKKKTLCIFGDGAAEEDYVFAAMGFAASNKLPVLFVCVDNDLSILTKIETRRNWSITEVAKSFGMQGVEIADDPWSVLYSIRKLTQNLPAFINCHVCRIYWHVGIGIDNAPEWDRYQAVKNELIRLGHEKKIKEIEEKVCQYMEKVWNKELLLKPSGK